MKTSRPKAEINLNKVSFGIPQQAKLYLFAENHVSILSASSSEKNAFEEATLHLLECDNPNARALGVFLKVFTEGGFGYNDKISVGSKGYIPQNVGLACMCTTPAFDGQSGIATGYPYHIDAGFIPFCDTVPVTIEGISQMSPLHKRYGLSFTRALFLTRSAESPSTLKFASIVPYGGFVYLPASSQEYATRGALVYAFGETKESVSTRETAIAVQAQMNTDDAAQSV